MIIINHNQRAQMARVALRALDVPLDDERLYRFAHETTHKWVSKTEFEEYVVGWAHARKVDHLNNLHRLPGDKR